MQSHWSDHVAPGRRGQANPGARRPASGLKATRSLEERGGSMPKLQTFAALVAALAMLVLAGAATAAPVTVNLRVEGSTQTLFDGPITTDAKSLTKDNTGSHPCDGTNRTVNPTPGPTM